MESQKTYNKMILFNCESCGIEGIVEYMKNFDEAFLEFLIRWDKGEFRQPRQITDSLESSDIIQSKDEIKKMMSGLEVTEITKSILDTRMDYVAMFKRIKYSEPEFGESVNETGINKEISDYLESKEITKLYKFQEKSFNEISFGSNVIITAPTASGKTEAFLIPIINKIACGDKTQNVHALFVYPTKALARDQFPKIYEIARRCDISVSVFDGDTNKTERDKIIANPPHIIITNFDVIHYHLLYRTRFSNLLESVKFLVVDETHAYSGIFGTNVHYIIKRLKRIAKKMQYIAASATLSDAKKFCEKLFGEKMQGISGHGRRGEIDFVMLFPTLRTQRALMVSLTEKMTSSKHKTMVFSNSHRNSELLAIQSKKKKVNIKVHRAGLMANYRKSVENAFKDNSIDAISCTPTLELGIDIGNVDCVISSTIPVNRLLQRIGRAARKGQNGYAFLTLGNDPISQYYKNHPDDYFDDNEQVFIDPQNPIVEKNQVLSMACDKPISKHELPEHKEVIDKLIEEELLYLEKGRFTPDFKRAIESLEEFSIRGVGKSIDIFHNGKKVGDRILPIALEELHESAIYFLAGKRFRVKEFNYPENNHAKIEPVPKDYPYYTKSLTEEWPTIQEITETKKVFGMEIAFCNLLIEKKVYGYVNIELGQDVTQGEKNLLDRPLEYNFTTKGIVFHAPRPMNEIEKADNPEYVEASGFHATEHVVIEGSNMITGGMSQDLGGISLGASGLIFVYDGAIGGNGASRALFDRFKKVLERSLSIVKECPCKNEAGCPRCTFSYRCGNNNEVLHKKSAIEILQRINDFEETKLEKPSNDDRPLV